MKTFKINYLAKFWVTIEIKTQEENEDQLVQQISSDLKEGISPFDCTFENGETSVDFESEIILIPEENNGNSTIQFIKTKYEDSVLKEDIIWQNGN